MSFTLGRRSGSGRPGNGVIVIRHGYVGAEVTRDGPYYSIDLDYFDETPKGLDRAETLSETRPAFHDVAKGHLRDEHY